MNYKTEQEKFWAGEFGGDYIKRNQGSKLLAANIAFFSKSLQQSAEIKSVIEFGANIGMNLEALKLLYPDLRRHAVEINTKAAVELKKIIPEENVFNESILEFLPTEKYDLTLIKGVLIHIKPEELISVYKKLVESTSNFLLVAEYYNPSPVSIEYRGHKNKLYKRDFAGEILNQYPEMKLIDYGFCYHLDPNFPQDDITWFLMQKKKAVV